jgi:hypothetical protein
MLKVLALMLCSCLFTWFAVCWFVMMREMDIIAYQLQELKEMEDENI